MQNNDRQQDTEAQSGVCAVWEREVMEKIAKFFVSVVFLGGWFLGLIVSFNYTTVMGHPWVIYYLIATFVFLVSLRFAFKEDLE